MWLKGVDLPQEHADEDQYCAFPQGISHHRLVAGCDKHAAAKSG
jgi:hypothetical protein